VGSDNILCFETPKEKGRKNAHVDAKEGYFFTLSNTRFLSDSKTLWFGFHKFDVMNFYDDDEITRHRSSLIKSGDHVLANELIGSIAYCLIKLPSLFASPSSLFSQPLLFPLFLGAAILTHSILIIAPLHHKNVKTMSWGRRSTNLMLWSMPQGLLRL
jgi:hypothetical protein